MAKPDIAPEQRGRPSAEEFAETLRALYDPQTPEERQMAEESRRRIRKTEARLRRALPPGESAEVLMTRIGPGPSGEVLMTRVGPDYPGSLYPQTDEDGEGDEKPIMLVRTHELPLGTDLKTIEEV